MTKANNNQNKTKKTSYKVFLNELLDGSIMTKDVIRKNYRLALLMVVLIFLYINNHYAVILQLSEMDTLQKEVTEAKYEALTRSSDLMREKRQSNIVLKLQERGLTLKESEEPPFRLEKDTLTDTK
jgi:hypothetical protein